jgi:hypothetical protein
MSLSHRVEPVGIPSDDPVLDLVKENL